MTTTSSAQRVVLACHPDTPSAAVRGIRVCVQRASEVTLKLTFSLHATIAAVRVPPPHPPRRVDGLWQHTCFETFVAADGDAYYELNFSPSGEWAAFTFRRYREGAPLTDEELAPRITVRTNRDQLELDAVVLLDRLLSKDFRAPLRLALAAVVEEEGGTLSYWALRHPPGTPDFHHPDAFALQIGPLEVDARSDPE